MLNFDYNIKTEIMFGKGQIEKLGKSIKPYCDRVLMVYGGGSIKRTGIYDKVVKELKENDIEFVELGGIAPNPRIESVREGLKLCRENKLDGVLAVGGGSSIDCSKVIASSVNYGGDPWDIVLDGSIAKDVLPVFSVLTLSATGSEMNAGAVISDLTKNRKLGTGNPGQVPRVSILDPEFTFTVNAKHTAAGTADIMSHTFENYFTRTDGAYLQSRMAEAILKTCIHYGPIAVREPENYEARANLMWASSLAINGILSLGTRKVWSVHPMEHELSAYYDITHGIGLAILTPRWMKHVLDENSLDKFVDFGVNVWGIDKNLDKNEIAEQAIQKTYDFFKNELNIPMTLKEVGIGEEKLEVMAEMAVKGKSIDGYRELKKEDVYSIYKASL